MSVLDPATSPVLDPVTAPKRASVFEDLIDIYYAPSQVFERRREGEYGAALIIYMLLSAGLLALFWTTLEAAFAADGLRQIESAIRRNPQMPAAMAETMRTRANNPSMLVTALTVFVITGIAALGGAVTLWVTGKLLDARATFAQAMTASTYAMAPALINWILLGVVGLFMPRENPQGLGSLLFGPTRFMDRNALPEWLYQATQRFEVFTLWGVVIAGIGIAVMTRTTKARGIAVAAIAWAFATVLLAAAGAACS